MNQPSTSDRLGIWCALGAFTIWGLSPLYFRAVDSVPPAQVVAHRVIWSAALLSLWLAWRAGWAPVRAALGRPRTLGLMGLTTVLITGNWLIYVWAVHAGRTIEASLGYFINPLMNVLLGALVLGERLRLPQWVAIALAATGVALRVGALGQLPWIALLLALTFATYGLLRKQASVDAVTGLYLETLIALPVAAAYLAWLAMSDSLSLGAGPGVTALLPLAGLITTVPLALFATAARRLPLSTVGLIQYLSPTLNFLVAVWVFGEPFDLAQLAAFACIWAGLAVFSLDLLRARPPAAPATP